MFTKDSLVRPLRTTLNGHFVPLDVTKNYRVMAYNDEDDEVFIVSEELVVRGYPAQLFVAVPDPMVANVKLLIKAIDSAREVVDKTLYAITGANALQQLRLLVGLPTPSQMMKPATATVQ